MNSRSNCPFIICKLQYASLYFAIIYFSLTKYNKIFLIPYKAFQAGEWYCILTLKYSFRYVIKLKYPQMHVTSFFEDAHVNYFKTCAHKTSFTFLNLYPLQFLMFKDFCELKKTVHLSSLTIFYKNRNRLNKQTVLK